MFNIMLSQQDDNNNNNNNIIIYQFTCRFPEGYAKSEIIIANHVNFIQNNEFECLQIKRRHLRRCFFLFHSGIKGLGVHSTEICIHVVLRCSMINVFTRSKLIQLLLSVFLLFQLLNYSSIKSTNYTHMRENHKPIHKRILYGAQVLTS